MSSRDLTEGPVAGHLRALATPMIAGIVAVMSSALADAFFVGRLGTQELAAIGYTFPVVLTLSSLAIGLGAGAASVVSRAIGRKDRSAVRRLATDSLGLALVVVTLACAFGWLTIEPLFVALGAKAEVLDHVVAYMRIWYLSLPFLVVPMVANNLIRATGDATLPSLIMIASALANVALNPVFIFGLGPIPALEVAGAAWATLLSRTVTLGMSLWILVNRERLLDLAWPGLAKLKRSWAEVLRVGLPAAGGNMVNPLGVMLVTAFLASFGTGTVAAFGVATRIESFAAIPMLALSSAIGPVTGQNWGAERRDRALQALRQAFAFCAGYSLIVAALLFAFGRTIASWFTDDPTVIEEATLYLKITPITLAGYGAVTIAAASFNALGRPLNGLGYYLLRSLALYVPLSWLAARLFEPQGVFVAIALANAAAGAFVVVHALRWLACAEQDDCDPRVREEVAAPI